MEVLKDYLSSCVISDGKRLDDYTRVYFKTNEDLCTIYSNIDFQKKDVFSVLASSDQVFTARHLGAKTVNSFDKNSLALYYYYLRLWTIKYREQLYPEAILKNDYRWLFHLLMEVESKSDEERHAVYFWAKHLQRKSNLSQLFFDRQNEGKVLFETSDLIEHVDNNMEFRCINLFEENQAYQGYDIILLSNIIEWARGNDEKIICIRDNLDKFLRQDGIVLCSSLINRCPDKIVREREIFDSYFDFIDYGKGGYVYQKR